MAVRYGIICVIDYHPIFCMCGDSYSRSTYGSTLAPQPIAYQARAVAKEIRRLKFEDENTPFHEELSIEEKDFSLGKKYFLKKGRYKNLPLEN
jgi:hypothetical protein